MSDTQTQASAACRAPVLMPALVPGTFDYRVPADAVPGTLVEATLAGKTRIGAVWDGPTDAAVPDAKIKPVQRSLDLPPLKPAFRRFIDWVADYTLAPKGAVLSLCGLSHAAKTTRTRYLQPAFVPNLPVLNTDQQQAFHEMLDAWQSNESSPKPLVLDGVTGSGKTEVYFHAIAQVLGLEGDVSNSGGDALPSAPKARARSEGVASAKDELASQRRRDAPFTPLTAKINTKQILVLVPEIALTHQWFERFEKAFGAPAAVWHSQQTPAARARVWQAVARGEARIVVGARSALFLPFADLGLIVVDEEHDPSYKQEDGVLYHARDMAVVRSRFEQVPVLLVSATPSLETMVNIEEGKYQALHLHQRYGAAGMPTVALLDMRNHPPERGDFLSPVLKQAMLDTLARGEQVLLFLNRRGYAPLLLCRACGHRFQCSDCSAWLVVHGTHKNSEKEWASAGGARSIAQDVRSAEQRKYLSCHHCNHREPFPRECPSCKADAEKLAACGPGVERIADEVRAMFPASAEENRAVRIALLSSDEAVAAEDWAAIERGEVDIIVGTQMVAKGHHFPRLTLVGVVDADLGLQGADLRAGERTYQLLHQLGGRAGRSDMPGQVLIQTYEPNHAVMQALAAQDREAVLRLERAARMQGGWPPYGMLAAILLDGVNEAEVRRAAQQLAQRSPQDARVQVLGPAPAPLSRLRGQYRYRLLVKIQPGIHPQRTLRAWLDGARFKGVRIKIDVNPYYFL